MATGALKTMKPSSVIGLQQTERIDTGTCLAVDFSLIEGLRWRVFPYSDDRHKELSRGLLLSYDQGDGYVNAFTTSGAAGVTQQLPALGVAESFEMWIDIGDNILSIFDVFAGKYGLVYIKPGKLCVEGIERRGLYFDFDEIGSFFAPEVDKALSFKTTQCVYNFRDYGAGASFETKKLLKAINAVLMANKNVKDPRFCLILKNYTLNVANGLDTDIDVEGYNEYVTGNVCINQYAQCWFDPNVIKDLVKKLKPFKNINIFLPFDPESVSYYETSSRKIAVMPMILPRA